MSSKKNTPFHDVADTPNALNPMTASVSYRDMRATAVSLMRQALSNPLISMKHTLRLLADDWEILLGRSEREPDPKDRRFQDPAWQKNPYYRIAMQHWLAAAEHMEHWAEDLDLEEDERVKAEFATRMIADAAAPSNFLFGNPSAIKKFFETGGTSLVRGSENMIQDLTQNGGLPSQVDKSAFKVGENLAATPGKVIWRSHLLELIQYQPTTEKVRKIPYLGIPPQINKFYLFDLSPEKSLIRHLVAEGFQCFWLSWRNPTKDDRDFGMSDYLQELRDAMDVVSKVSRSDVINVGGACSGGITLATLASKLASEADSRINSLTLKVCVLDTHKEDTEIAQLSSDETIESAREASQRSGLLKGDELARTFAWMRPNDLIWNYYVNNYLLGEDPPAFDILYWNADTTNLSAALHSDFLDINIERAFARPGEIEMAEHFIDLTKVDQDAFVVAGMTDHITPWKACYRTTQLLGSKNIEFILSSSGHIQALLNPPSNPKAKYFKNTTLPESADEWLDSAEQVSKSWWELWSKWLHERSGDLKIAPKKLGNKAFPPLDEAPGKYVFGQA